MNKFSKISACRNLVGKFLKVSSSDTLLSDFYRKGVSPAFTLAEMMVVLLIMSIILAAMAPVMTTRDSSMRDNSSPWKWTDDRADTYFGLGDTQTAMIGQKEKKEIDGNYARLIINAVTGHDDEAAHILFKKGEDAITGRLYLSGGNTFLSNGSLKGSVNTAIGYNTLLDNESGQANTAIGAEAMKQNKGNNNTAVGANAYHLGTGENNTVVGVDAFAENSGSNNTAIGVHALRYVSGSNNIGLGYQANMAEKTVNNTIAIGQNAETTASNAISIGINSKGNGKYATVLGEEARSDTTNSIAIGYKSKITLQRAKDQADNAIAIGYNASVVPSIYQDYMADSAIALGVSSYAAAKNSIAIGREAYSYGENTIALGYKATGGWVQSIDTDSIAIGTRAYAPSDYTIAIGYESNALETNSISIGSNTVYKGEYGIAIGDNTSVDADNVIAIGKDVSVVMDRSNAAEESIAMGQGASILSDGKGITYEGARIYSQGSIAIGVNSTINNAADSIAIGPDSLVRMPTDTTTDRHNGIAIGHGTVAAGKNAIAIGAGASTQNWDNNPDYPAMSTDGIAIGTNSNARTDGTVAIGGYSCKYAGRAMNVCLGTNSGPLTIEQQDAYDDGQEHVYIGSKSKYNGGAAVLEVHNTNESGRVNSAISHEGGPNIYPFSKTGVVINGNLFVKGYIITGAGKHDNYLGNGAFLLGRAHKDDTHAYLWAVNDEQNADIYYNNALGGIGGTKVVNPNGGGAWYSDRRLKYVGKENTSGLDKIRQLKVFNYTFKKDETKTPHVGVIAQDLQKIFPDAVSKAKDGFLKIRFEDMFYAMINAIKELDAKYKAQEQRINELEKRIEQLEAKIK